MYSHPLEDGVVLLQLKALGRVLTILRRDVTRRAGHTTCLVFGALKNHLNSVSFCFLCHNVILLSINR